MTENGINELKLKFKKIKYANLVIVFLHDLVGNISSEVISEFTIHFYFNEKILTPVNSRFQHVLKERVKPSQGRMGTWQPI